jgi:DNA primase
LRDAELALGQDATDSSYGWLRDVKTRLAAVDGTEALIEGFGELSGRSGKDM